MNCIRPLALSVDRRVDQSRGDAVHPDADAPRGRGPPGRVMTDDAAFRGRVGGLSDLTVERRDGGDVHDGTALAFVVHRVLVRDMAAAAWRRQLKLPIEVDACSTNSNWSSGKGLPLPVHGPVGIPDTGSVDEGPQRAETLSAASTAAFDLARCSVTSVFDELARELRPRRPCPAPRSGRQISGFAPEQGEPACARLSDARSAARDEDRCAIQFHLLDPFDEVALAMPPPSHMTWSPYLPSRRSSSLTRVDMSFVPEQPGGDPGRSRHRSRSPSPCRRPSPSARRAPPRRRPR